MEGLLERLRADHDAAVRHALADVDVVRDFHGLYPDATGTISHFAGGVGDQSWTSRAFLYDRYELSMQLPVKASASRVEAVGEPSFILLEIRCVEDLGGGRFSVRYGHSWRFGPERWEQLKQAHGRIEEVFLEQEPWPPGFSRPAELLPFTGIRVDDPVESFAAYAARLRSR